MIDIYWFMNFIHSQYNMSYYILLYFTSEQFFIIIIDKRYKIVPII